MPPQKKALASLRRAPPGSPKKWRARWSDGSHTDFGARGYSDYTMHRDPARREAYRRRHARDPIDDPYTAGALSYWLLWGEHTGLDACLRDYRRRFGV
jgi:hypothetical protein